MPPPDEFGAGLRCFSFSGDELSGLTLRLSDEARCYTCTDSSSMVMMCLYYMRDVDSDRMYT